MLLGCTASRRRPPCSGWSSAACCRSCPAASTRCPKRSLQQSGAQFWVLCVMLRAVCCTAFHICFVHPCVLLLSLGPLHPCIVLSAVLVSPSKVPLSRYPRRTVAATVKGSQGIIRKAREGLVQYMLERLQDVQHTNYSYPRGALLLGRTIAPLVVDVRFTAPSTRLPLPPSPVPHFLPQA